MFIDHADDRNLDLLLAYVAVRFAGYWSEGFVTLSHSPSAALTHAQKGLAAMLKSVRDGVTFAELAAIATKHIEPYAIHPLVQNSIGNSIGLSLEEPYEFIPEQSNAIQSGGIYTLRCGVASQAWDAAADNAIVSAMISIAGERAEILWSCPRQLKRNAAMTVLEQMGEWLAAYPQQQNSPALTERLGIHLLDAVGAWIAGRSTEEGAMVARLKVSPGTSPSLLSDHPLDRIALGCATIRLTEIDDIHMLSCTTPSSVVVPVALYFAAAQTSPVEFPHLRRSSACRL